MRVEEAPVGQHDHMLAVVSDGIGTGRIDHDGAVHAHRFLHARMTVIPVGAGLAHRELVIEGLSCTDPGEAHARNAVHLERQQQAVPMDRAFLLQRIADREADIVPLLQPDHRPRNRAVDADRMTVTPADADHHMADVEPNFFTRNCRHRRNQPRRTRLRPGGQRRREGKAAAPHKPERISKRRSIGKACIWHQSNGECLVPLRSLSLHPSFLRSRISSSLTRAR
jgi:hypothetical protein